MAFIGVDGVHDGDAGWPISTGPRVFCAKFTGERSCRCLRPASVRGSPTRFAMRSTFHPGRNTEMLDGPTSDTAQAYAPGVSVIPASAAYPP